MRSCRVDATWSRLRRSLLVGACTSLSVSLVGCSKDNSQLGPCSATALVFAAQPGNTTGGAPLPPVRVEAHDASGALASCFSGAVTLSLGSNPTGDTLSGTTKAPAVAGVATFTDVRIDKAGVGYALTARASGVQSSTSASFSVMAGPATGLAFLVQPGTTLAAAGITPAVAVVAIDAGGNRDTTYGGAVTIVLGVDPGGGALSGTTTRSAVAGVATFTGLSIDKGGTGYTLTASATGLSAATSASFSIVQTQLAYMVQPSTAVAGGAITPAVAVAVIGPGGSTDTSFTGAVTITIGANPGGGTLSGTTTQTAAAGVATFPNLSIDNAATGYTLVVSASGLTPDTSASFDVTALQPPGVLPLFGHAVIVVEENTSYSEVTDSTMPHLFTAMTQYALATQYYANTHPSIGNYFEMTAGQIITNNDSYSLTVTADNIVRHLLAAGKTWKSYAEDLPSVGYTGPSTGNYARKHNPLSFFSDVVNDSVQVKRLVPFTQFALDLAGDTLPNYSFVVPNLCNDAHDCSLQTADNWLQANIAPLLSNPSFQRDGLLIVVFDEASGDNTNGGGRVVWTAISPKARLGYTSTTLYQHQNTLRLMAEGLGLTSFPGDAASASNMAEFFNP